MRITFFKHSKDNRPMVVETNWAGLAASLQKTEFLQCNPCLGHDCPAKRGKAWSPAEYREGEKRGNRGVVALHALVFDLDGCTRDDVKPLFARLKAEGFGYILHSTHSHATVDAGHVCLRVVLPLSRPATPEEWPLVWSRAVQYFQAPCDVQCKDLARLYFLPSAPAGSEPIFLKVEGKPLDVDDVVVFSDLKSRLSASANPLAKKVLMGEPLAVPGERDAQINRWASFLAATFKGEPTFEELVEISMPSFSKMEFGPGGLTEALGKFEEKYNRHLRRLAAEREAQEKVRASAIRPTGPTTPTKREDLKQALLQIKGIPTPCDFNVKMILSQDPDWHGRLRYNALENREEIDGRTLTDLDSTEVMSFLNVFYGMHSRPSGLEQCIGAVCHLNSYDPLKTYLNGLAWDGVNRLDSWLQRYAGVEDTLYTRAVGRKWLIGAVARGLDPGSQLDTVLILEGEQGAGKSSLFRALGGEFFAESKLDIGSKDGLAVCGKKWIIELAEIDGLTKYEANQVRAFLTTTIDTYRPPYGRRVIDVARRCAFAGTSNKDEYLHDETGARRFWPVRVETIDIEALRADRDQLWAEAVAVYNAQKGSDYLYYLTPAETELHKKETDARNKGTSQTQLIIKWWLAKGKPLEFSKAEVLEGALRKDLADVTEMEENRLGRSLHKAGFLRIRKMENGVRESRYAPNSVLLALPAPGPKLNVVKEG